MIDKRLTPSQKAELVELKTARIEQRKQYEENTIKIFNSIKANVLFDACRYHTYQETSDNPKFTKRNISELIRPHFYQAYNTLIDAVDDKDDLLDTLDLDGTVPRFEYNPVLLRELVDNYVYQTNNLKSILGNDLFWLFMMLLGCLLFSVIFRN